ncbi:MAG TPA: hypothetical protein VD968_17145 [Pyrinomonadaceae bacterium]|nr:hypothetical protein [Pyrinomonadaceae bacterium]
MRGFGSLRSGAACALAVAALVFQAGGSAAAQRRPPVVVPQRGAFEVEVVVGGRTLERLHARGRTYVEALEGEEYELRVRNPLPVRVAVALSVDGLSTIDARRSSAWESSKWVIEPYQTITVSGWQMSRSHARRFYFTTERDSYAARLGRASDLGVITAVFFREAAPRTVPVLPPASREERNRGGDADELRGEADNSAGSAARSGSSAQMRAPRPKDDDYAATGIGRAVGHGVTWTTMSLERGPAAEVTIRYEYRDALVRLGVLPRPRYEGDDALRRRERARGFSPEPGFCPEPE